MASAHWRQTIDLMLRSAVDAGRGRRFDFLSLMRLIECANPDQPRLGEAASPAQEAVRLRASPALDFAPATLAEVARIEDGRLLIDVRFLSLFGPNGALPLHLTEYAWDRLHNHRDPTLARFADVFHHRMLLAFYRACAQADPAVSYDREDDDVFALQLGAIGAMVFSRFLVGTMFRTMPRGLFWIACKTCPQRRVWRADHRRLFSKCPQRLSRWRQAGSTCPPLNKHGSALKARPPVSVWALLQVRGCRIANQTMS
ncbi:MAG: type VI secretion system baseplate subunit TssG [Uliginosibacterium sp.]|nr:type VI secretion system baseplate subunit TssG [Uliginosibacterium sp.]